MANRYYNAALGASQKVDVAEGSSDTSAYAAFRVTYDATGNSKLQALQALEAIREAIITDTWPPA